MKNCLMCQYNGEDDDFACIDKEVAQELAREVEAGMKSMKQINEYYTSFCDKETVDVFIAMIELEINHKTAS